MTLNQLQYVVVLSGENSINEAAKKLFISQPSLTAALKSLEQEIGFDIFIRNKSGISLTVRGAEFIGYAKSVIEQYEILDARFVSRNSIRRSFHVSMQHYTFAVNAFIEIIKRYGMEEYEFEVHETKTREVIENVRDRKSEIGVLYMNDFNRAVLSKIIREAGLTFTPLFTCGIYAYLHRSNPLSEKKSVTLEELNEYPCLVFSQGDYNSFYYAEEVLSTYNYKRVVRANDRATLLNLMVGIRGFTLCSGLICEDLNGTDYCAVRLETGEKMTIGTVVREASVLSEMGEAYIEELSRYRDAVMD